MKVVIKIANPKYPSKKFIKRKARIDVVWSLPALAALSYMPVYYIMQWGCRERGLLEQ